MLEYSNVQPIKSRPHEDPRDCCKASGMPTGCDTPGPSFRPGSKAEGRA